MKQSDYAFSALGDDTRRAIFEKIKNGPMPVVDIAEGMPVSRPAVSQHLKVLTNARLIKINRKGTRNFYQIDHQGIIAMRFYLDQFWEDALTAFKHIAEINEQKEK